MAFATVRLRWVSLVFSNSSATNPDSRSSERNSSMGTRKLSAGSLAQGRGEMTRCHLAGGPSARRAIGRNRPARLRCPDRQLADARTVPSQVPESTRAGARRQRPAPWALEQRGRHTGEGRGDSPDAAEMFVVLSDPAIYEFENSPLSPRSGSPTDMDVWSLAPHRTAGSSG